MPVQPHPCANCGITTTNPRFCSRKCSAAITNREVHKRKKNPCICSRCGGETSRYDRKYCDKCHKLIDRIDWENATLSDLKSATGSRNSFTSAIYYHARSIAVRHTILRCCAVCGYATFVHCCHKTPVRSFTLDTKIVVVNSIENLVGLCPNHHWEFDHGILALPDHY